jgi:hypothetical protein
VKASTPGGTNPTSGICVRIAKRKKMLTESCSNKDSLGEKTTDRTLQTLVMMVHKISRFSENLENKKSRELLTKNVKSF